MGPDPEALPGALVWPVYAVALVCLLLAIRQAPWGRFADRRLQHVYLGATVAVLLLWSLRAGLSSGLAIHLLGMTTLTLMWGWALALIAPALVGAGLLLAGIENGQTLGMLYLCAGVLPVATSWTVFRLADRHLPRHLFVYLFVSVFANAALASVAGSLLRALLLAAAGVYGWFRLSQEYLLLLPLVALPEALLNGFIMTLLVAFRPHWVVTFDDQRYLDKK